MRNKREKATPPTNATDPTALVTCALAVVGDPVGVREGCPLGVAVDGARDGLEDVGETDGECDGMDVVGVRDGTDVVGERDGMDVVGEMDGAREGDEVGMIGRQTHIWS